MTCCTGRPRNPARPCPVFHVSTVVLEQLGQLSTNYIYRGNAITEILQQNVHWSRDPLERLRKYCFKLLEHVLQTLLLS